MAKFEIRISHTDRGDVIVDRVYELEVNGDPAHVLENVLDTLDPDNTRAGHAPQHGITLKLVREFA